MRRLLVLVVLLMVAAASLSPASAAVATAPPDSSGSTSTADTAAAPTTTIDNSFLDTDRQLSECLNNSVELPGCGRAPTQEGDRGGALQLVTFLVLTVGIAFIFWRVARGIKARDAALAAKVR